MQELEAHLGIRLMVDSGMPFRDLCTSGFGEARPQLRRWIAGTRPEKRSQSCLVADGKRAWLAVAFKLGAGRSVAFRILTSEVEALLQVFPQERLSLQVELHVARKG